MLYVGFTKPPPEQEARFTELCHVTFHKLCRLSHSFRSVAFGTLYLDRDGQTDDPCTEHRTSFWTDAEGEVPPSHR